MKSYKIKDLLEDIFSGDWGDESNDGGGINVIRTTDFKEYGRLSYSNIEIRKIKHSVAERKMLKEGDIIIEKSGGGPNQPVGRVAFFNFPELPLEVPIKNQGEIFICNNFCSVLRPNGNKVEKEYLFHYLREFYSEGRTVRFQNKTTGLINLNLSDYLEEKILIHENLSEQKIIVELINKAEQLIYKRRKSISLIDEFTRNTFNKMFGDLARNEKKWKKVEFKHLAKIVKVQVTPNEFKNDDFYIGLEDIEKDTGNIIKTSQENAEELKSSKFRFTKEHILYSKLRPYLNKVALPNKSGICSTDIFPILPNKNVALRYFICYLMRSRYFLNEMTVRSVGANLPRVNPETLENLIVPKPPIQLQRRFTLVVDQTEKIKRRLNESLIELESLYKSISYLAFKNRLNIDNLMLEHIKPKSSRRKIAGKNLTITSKFANVLSSTNEEILSRFLEHHLESEAFSFEEFEEQIKYNLNENEYDKIRHQLFDSLRGVGKIKVEQIFNETEKKIFLRVKK